MLLSDKLLSVNAIPKTPVIEITNVAEYIYAGTDQEYWGVEDWPNIAPPFQAFFMEWKAPRKISSKTWGDFSFIPEFRRYGVMFIALPAEEESFRLMRLGYRPQDARWVILSKIYAEDITCRVLDVLFSVSFCVDSSGALIELNGQGDYWWIIMDPSMASISGDIGESHNRLINPAMVAISFMHCKNVKTKEITPLPKLAHKHKKKTGIKLHRYHVLEIEPMKAVLKTEGRSDEVGAKKALHICRGHFKDYRDKGLFGQHKAIYWWDASVRGDAKRGTVEKDYRVVV